MKILLTAAALTIFATSAYAAKDCNELKSEIDAKIKSHGVPAYTLEIVDKGTQTNMQVVGTCGGDTKEIVYQRGHADDVATPTNDTKNAE